jgi:hypothetical protein
LRVSRVLLIVVVVAIVGLLALFAYSSLLAPSSSGPWAAGQAYPLQVGGTHGVVGESCVNGTSSIYCIGGIDYNGASRNEVYSASVSSSGMSGWASGPSYPETVGLQSCVSSAGYAYCVGGSYDDAGDDTASSYFASLTGGSAGAWVSTTPYPVAIDTQSCVSSSHFVYCVGGENETSGTNATLTQSNSVWYAPLSSSGIGAWTHTTPYPASVFFGACAATSTDVFCVGGTDLSGNAVSAVYFAPLTASGVGRWSSSTAYPMQAYGQTCLIASGNLVCVGGVPGGTTSSSDAVYSAPVSSSGVGAWHRGPNYPFGVETACAVAAGNLYCSGGYQDSSAISAATYYASVKSILG